VYREYHRAVAEQREIEFEVLYGPLGGWFEVRAIPTPGGLLALYRNVTARRRDELLLEGNLRAMTQLVLDAPLSSVLDAVTSTVERQSPHGALASVLLVSDDGLRLRHGSAPSLPDEYNRAVDGVAIGPVAGSCGTAAFRREQVIVEDIEHDPLWEAWRPVARAAGLRACWSTPVLDAAGRVLATFAMYYQAPRRPEAADQRLIAQAAGTVALAIEHDRRRRALHRALTAATSAAARSRRLQKLAAELTAALLPEQAALIGADYAREALEAQGAWVVIHDTGAHGRLLAAVGGPDPLAGALSRLDLRVAAGQASPEPLWLSSPSEVAALLATPEAEPAGSLAVLPLRAEGRTFGHLGVYRPGFHEFGAEERGEAMAVSAQVAQALVRASQFATTRGLAESLQRSLLTEPPKLEGMAVAVRYRPATTAAEVGGDWYDAFSLPTGLHLVIGDVMGHDLDAAGRMGQLRSFLRTLAHDRGGDPASLLQRLDSVNEELQVTEFTSLILARLRPDRGGLTVEWSNAGHPSALVVEQGGSGGLLTGSVDPPLGIGTGIARRNSTAHLPPGATLLFYTDGLVELSTRSLDERILELSRYAAGHADAPLDEFCDAVLGFAHHTADDVAVVAVRGASPAAG
ncbi:MAG TPA: GAF domain-containing SpoIIE family protein phosphatase, partial [Acidimicrobiales bacterium]|nr:GAF domain-containing SpoIIE family protein phosphatase [Acidimicrobiales bacterium]